MTTVQAHSTDGSIIFLAAFRSPDEAWLYRRSFLLRSYKEIAPLFGDARVTALTLADWGMGAVW